MPKCAKRHLALLTENLNLCIKFAMHAQAYAKGAPMTAILSGMIFTCRNALPYARSALTRAEECRKYLALRSDLFGYHFLQHIISPHRVFFMENECQFRHCRNNLININIVPCELSYSIEDYSGRMREIIFCKDYCQ